jgi:hypothetical protein
MAVRRCVACPAVCVMSLDDMCACRSDACANVVATRTTPPHGVPLKCTRWLALAAGSTALTMTSGDDDMLLCRRGCIQEAHRSLAFLTLSASRPLFTPHLAGGFRVGRPSLARLARLYVPGGDEQRPGQTSSSAVGHTLLFLVARPNGEQRKSSPTRVMRPAVVVCECSCCMRMCAAIRAGYL